MLNWYHNLFEKNWRVLGTHPFYYSNADGENIFLMSATYYINSKSGGRKVDVDYDHTFHRIFPPMNHPAYHNFCIPFLRKTGDFASDVMAEKMVLSLCSETYTEEAEYIKNNVGQLTPVKRVDNVVSLFKRDTVQADD
jgi:hypothetical protein